MNLSDKIMERLKASQYWNARTRISGNTIQGIVCPACGDKSAWGYAPGASVSNPMAICCNKQNTCGTVTKTMELFNIELNIEKEYPATPKDKHRPAREYLKNRGLKTSLESLPFEYWSKIRKLTTGAVMWPLQSPGEKTVYNGRLLNPKDSDGKTHNSASTTGCFWLNQGIKYDQNLSTFVTEGIIDSLSLIELGFQSIAILAAGQDPQKVNFPPLGKLVFAFDNDQAGAKALKKWKAAYPEADAVMCDKGRDWNDFLRSGNPSKLKTIFRKNYERYQINAQLAVSATANQYAAIYNDFHKKAPGLFLFKGCTFFSYTRKKGDETQTITERVLAAKVKVISFLKDGSNNPEQPEYLYHLQITPKGSKVINSTAQSRDLATVRGMKEYFLARARVTFEGGSQAATALSTFITGSSNTPVVSQLSLTGYDPASRWYFFKNFAIDDKGKLHTPDKRSLYKLDHRSWCKAAAHAGEKSIKLAKTGASITKIHKLITDAYGKNGAAAFAWTVAGWFVSDIKDQTDCFTFMSLHGDPASGKSALTVILNALQGFDAEGIPLSQLNTKKALARSISRVSGLFTALLEDNQRNDRSFDYSVILTGYNKGPLQIRAAFSGDNRTTESPFLGSLLFVQNSEPFNQPAEKQRVVSLHFDHDQLTESTRSAYEELYKIPKQELARTIMLVLQQRKTFENGWNKAFKQAINDLSGCEHRRILENHALVLAFHRLFCQVFKIDYDLTDFMLETAKKKVISAAAREQNMADYFFEVLDLLMDDDSEKEKLRSCVYVDKKKKLLYINLPGIEERIRYRGTPLYINDTLTSALTRHPAFIRSSHRFRFPKDPNLAPDLRPKIRRVWVFDAFKIVE
jgi:Toprim-like